jgi:hypothetical protein|tara:strand:+ start:151 stop:474 length:324 start_codon:yes stop_codon:yes gene_type:complete
MCRLLAALRLSTHTEHVLPPHLAARFHKLPVCRGDGGESSPIPAFSAQVQPVIVSDNACEATDANLTTKSVNADAPRMQTWAGALGKESTGAVRSYDGRRAECERRL